MGKPTAKTLKDKVMVYLDPALRRGMGVLAAERGMRTSDLYAEAANEYLQSWRRSGVRSSAVAEPGPTPSPSMPVDDAIHRILKKLDGHSQILGDIRVNTTSLVPAVEARALAIVIVAVVGAGQEGITTSAAKSVLEKEGFRGSTSTVRDVLLQAGVITYNEGRWRNRDPQP